MSHQLTRNNHYVPVWYQKAFLPAGDSQLHYLDIRPDEKTLPNGLVVRGRSVSRRAPKSCFCTYDLYTTQFGTLFNDEIERYLFGAIDDEGAQAVRAFARNDHRAIHGSFSAFFEYLDAQKLRTPKGLDWIRSRYPSLSQLDLMQEMQGLRRMHCTMWMEAVREIVSAEDSDVKFIVTDHPVTIYNAAFPPDSHECSYPLDPSIELIGTQSVFVLNAESCLILSHLEYAKSPDAAPLTVSRTNARFSGSSLVRTDAFIRKRKLTRDEVLAINYCLKSRARRFVAASQAEWLYPERTYVGTWRDIAKVLAPRDDLWQFGGEIYVGYHDGSTQYQDAFGRTTGAHEYLRKKQPPAQLRPDDPCGCGSGLEFHSCCEPLSSLDRPSWGVYGIRERNLMFLRAAEDILELRSGKTWEDVRRQLSDEQVRRIHELFGTFWPVDTDLTELLPRPNANVLRAVYLGMPDPRTLSIAITGWLAYFDQIVIPHPFTNPAHIKPEYSPTASPSQHKEQTLKNLCLLFMLEPYIDAGYVHCVPDPADVSLEFARTVMKLAKERGNGWQPKRRSRDRERFRRLAEDEHKRFLARLPDQALRKEIRSSRPDIDNATLDAVITHLRTDAEQDLYALLRPMESGEAGAQLKSVKGYCLETALYLAALSGAIVYTDVEAHWEQLHQHTSAIDPAQVAEGCLPFVDAFKAVTVPIALDWGTPFDLRRAGKFDSIRALLRGIFAAVISGPAEADVANLVLSLKGATERIKEECPSDSSIPPLDGRMEVSVPKAGFERNEVRRLLLTFGRGKAIQPVQVAIMISV